MEITEDIRYIGVNDHDIDLFEGQYDVSENGMSYNSYVILSDKVAVADTVDAHFVDEWLGNLEAVLDGRTPDYLIVHHMEPDHSAGIAAFMERYPEAQVVSSAMAFKMMKIDFGTVSGMLCGSMANPMALNYVNDTIPGDNPSVAYATVYPLCMFLRVIIAQVLLMFLLN